MTRDLGQDDVRAILYPPMTPYDCGRLDVGDGHMIYWEACGARGGKPAVFLHGGPGGGCSADNRRLFDPTKYDALLFDQRGCGRSLPFAALHANTTRHLLDDIEKLRKFRGVESWLVVGGSWGSTLALAYAQRFRERVSALVVRGVFTARRSELDWLYKHGASNIFPEAWETFRHFALPSERDDLIAAYHRRLTAPDPSTREAAARAWCAWEAACMTLSPRPSPRPVAGDRDKLYALALLETHYFMHDAFLGEGEVLRGANRLRGLPGAIVQGRYDCVTPPKTAWELHRAWPGSILDIAPEAGHASSESGIAKRLVGAVDAFARDP